VSGWGGFGLLVGVVAGLLVAALFVVLAIRPDAMASPGPRHRAAQGLGLLLTAVTAGLLLAVPGQSWAALGVELIVLAVVAGVGAALVDRRGRTADDGAGVRIVEVGTPNLVVAALAAAAGICLVAGEQGGLYLLVVALLGALAGGVVNAWLVLGGPVRSGSPPVAR
jgi:hypothetical protein